VSAVIFDMSMSLDGYVRAANPRPDEPLGEGGEALQRDDRHRGRTRAGTRGRQRQDREHHGRPRRWQPVPASGPRHELSIHLVPVLFGAGTRLTETLPAHIELELADQVSAPSAAHLRYGIKRAS
jgi:hypothetical protein